MYNYNQHLHFIGIGGVGMAGIAEVLLNLGYSVSGSDIKHSALVEHLEDLGAEVSLEHGVDNLPAKTTVVVVSSAIDESNVELIAARERNITVIPRAEMLAEIMRMKYGISIAGSHGKTTTTSMTAKVLSDAGLDPTVIIGGRVLSRPSGAQVGTGPYVVAEADESDGSFCLLKPAIAVVTNIDMEHLSHYGTFGALEEAFFQFMESIPFYGVVIACIDDPVVARVVDQLSRRVITYGTSPCCDIVAQDIEVVGASSCFTLSVHGVDYGKVTIPLPGVHLVRNSLAVIAVAVELGVFAEEAVQSLSTFEGVARRSELVAEVDGVRVFDDYGHHPTEIAATLRAMRSGWIDSAVSPQGAQLRVLFQPHRYSRTKELFSEFLNAFAAADEVIVGEIYAAGEPATVGVTGESLARAIDHQNVTFCSDLSSCISDLLNRLRPGDVVVTLGAGDVGAVGHELGRLMHAAQEEELK